MGIAWTCVLAISPWQTSRYLMAKNEHVVLRSAVVATISVISIYAVLYITVAAVNVVNANIDPTEMVFIRSEEHTSELQSRGHLVCRLLLEKKNENDVKAHQRYTN